MGHFFDVPGFPAFTAIFPGDAGAATPKLPQ
jgi:hypothetical protein